MNLFETLQQRRGRVLFVCETNSTISQMAEAFARSWGEDVMLAFSGGLAPCSIPPETKAVMAETRSPLTQDQIPKNLLSLDISRFDVIVNFGGCVLPPHPALVINSEIPAPQPRDLQSFREVRDRVEASVKFLVDHFRRAKEWRAGAAGTVVAASAQTGSVAAVAP